MSESKPSFYYRHQSMFIWVFVLGIIASGGYLSHIAFLGHEWISRAGCLIVISGIWFGLGGVIKERLLLNRFKGRRRNAIIRVRAELESRGTDQSEIDRQIDAIEESFDNQSDNLSQKLKVSVGVLEVSILITGTFLWGFGDLIAEFLLTPVL